MKIYNESLPSHGVKPYYAVSVRKNSVISDGFRISYGGHRIKTIGYTSYKGVLNLYLLDLGISIFYGRK